MLEPTALSQVQCLDRRWFWLPAIVVTVLHFVFLTLFFAPAISMPDANAYFAQARWIATEHRTWFTAESPAQYIPPHWLKTDDNRYFSKYPPGLPLIAAGVFRALGPEAALLVNPVMASLSLLALTLVCRQWMGVGWSLLAGGLMAVNPAANQQALWAFAHTAVGFFLVWGVFLAARWASSRSAWHALVAGFCVGVIPTIRYAEAAFAFGFAGFVVFQLREDRRFWRSALAGIVGAAFPMIALAVRNHLAFGGFWRTGYAMTGEQTGFGLGFLLEHAPSYLERLLSEGAGPLFGLAVVGIAVLCARKETRAHGTFLAVLIIPTTLLYMSYYFPVDRAAMRFLVPTLFIYPIAGVWTLRLLHDAFPRAATIGAIALLAITVAWGLPLSA